LFYKIGIHLVMEVLVVDNYDSFTFNLVHVIKNYGANIKTIKAKNIIIDEIKFFDKILFSPGPGLPGDGSIMEERLKHYESILFIRFCCNVCLFPYILQEHGERERETQYHPDHV